MDQEKSPTLGEKGDKKFVFLLCWLTEYPGINFASSHRR